MFEDVFEIDSLGVSRVILVSTFALCLPSCSAEAPAEAPEAPDAGARDASAPPDAGEGALSSEDAGEDARHDLGAPTTPCSVETLSSTAEVSVIGEPIRCGGDAYGEGAEVECWHVKLEMGVPQTPDLPTGSPTLDDAVGPTRVAVTLRAPRGVDLCARRWISLDSGGMGPGYAIGFGQVGPGEFEQGEPMGDDMVHGYAADMGFVTMDIHWQCGRECRGTALEGWTPELGWASSTGGGGLTGLSSRSRALYQWANANNGGERLCAHSQSSGTGRLTSVLSRYGGEDLFRAVVFDGGPTMSYSPWICGIDQGPMGARPSWYGSGGTPQNKALMDCMYSDSEVWAGCDFDACSASRIDPALVRDSPWLFGTDRNWERTSVGVVMGGRDSSNARHHSALWLQGWSPSGLSGLGAQSLVVRQGYCRGVDGTYRPDQDQPEIPCSLWDMSTMPAADIDGTGYDERLRGVSHSTAWSSLGVEVLSEVMVGDAATEGLCGPALLNR